jgi:hypothetical protein
MYRLGVVAHTSRTAQALLLQDRADAARLFIDDGTLGCERNHHRVWEWLAGETTDWAVVLEDDAIITDSFRQQLDMVLTAAPTPIVSLYRGHNVNNRAFETNGLLATGRADTENAHWVTAPHLLHAVGVAIRTELVPDMLTHIGPLPDKFPIDERISHWAKTVKQQISYCHPSIVDHADGATAILTHHRRDKLPRPAGRVAYQYGTRDMWNSEGGEAMSRTGHARYRRNRARIRQRRRVLAMRAVDRPRAEGATPTIVDSRPRATHIQGRPQQRCFSSGSPCM